MRHVLVLVVVLSAAGVAQQIDFYIRSPQQNPKNRQGREVFAHFFGMRGLLEVA
jgi:hypothetical protein